MTVTTLPVFVCPQLLTEGTESFLFWLSGCLLLLLLLESIQLKSASSKLPVQFLALLLKSTGHKIQWILFNTDQLYLLTNLFNVYRSSCWVDWFHWIPSLATVSGFFSLLWIHEKYFYVDWRVGVTKLESNITWPFRRLGWCSDMIFQELFLIEILFLSIFNVQQHPCHNETHHQSVDPGITHSIGVDILWIYIVNNVGTPALLEFEDNWKIVTSNINFKLIYRWQFKFELKLFKVVTISYILSLEVVLKFYHCQLWVLWENMICLCWTRRDLKYKEFTPQLANPVNHHSWLSNVT